MENRIPPAVVCQRLENFERAGIGFFKKAQKAVGQAPSAAILQTPTHDERVAPRLEQPAIGSALSSSTLLSTQTSPQMVQQEDAVAKKRKSAASGSDSRDARSAALAVVERKVAACTRCAELAKTRTQTVFGTGDPCARLVFCGEAPGADEDRQGIPFVGRAGQLLNDIIIKGMKMRREDVYILNILRCRPPDNRTPSPTEAAACREYLDRQLEIIRPEFICCLGAVAAQNLLGTDVAIGRLRGKVHDLHGIKVVCTYHPAYLLRNPPAKKYTWEDIKLLMAEMGMSPEA